MANTTLFQSLKTRLTAADTRNEAGGIAYTLTPKQQLAQLAATGCLNSTYYTDAQDQLEQVLELAENLDAEFIAKTAVYARQKGFMKDMPALLLAVLAQKDVNMLARVFDQVADNGKMLRNFAQIIRSGAVGRKSFGNRPKKLMQTWLLTATEKQLLNAAIGNAPSLADVVKMVHPKPREAWRATWFAWLIGKPYDREALPPITRAFEDYKQSRQGALPDVPFQMLTALELNSGDWAQIARNGSWQQVRQNLNTFLRHDVFAKSKNIKMVAEKLRDETAVQNVPAIRGKVVVCPDVSGSMHSSATGYRGSATSKTRCIDIAALVSAAMLRTNPKARVIPFERITVNVQLNPRDSIMTNAQKLANIGGGGTACSAPLAMLNREKADVDLVVIVSDNESWADREQHWGCKTGLMKEWDILKQRCPEAKLVCLDIQPYTTAQAQNRRDILNIGGFSDQVFTLIGLFAEQGMGADFWVEEIEKTELAAVN